MKKALALIIVVFMAFSLFACDNSQSNDLPSATPTPAATTPGNTPDTSGGTPDTPAGPTDPSVNANTIGYFVDGVDPSSRDTYDIVWAYMRSMALFLNIGDALREMESSLNYKITEYCANNDIDAMIQNIEIYADQGVDGFIIVIDASANLRIKDVLDDTGLPYIGILNTVRDSSGSHIVNTVGLDNYDVSYTITQWLFDNYKTYWGDIDTSKIALLNFDFSPNVDFHERYLAAEEKFLELFPENAGVFPADGAAGGLNEETGYDLASGILSGNPQIEYWFVVSGLELYTLGTARVVESLDIEDRVLMTCVNSDVLTAAWDSDYEGCWVSCLGTDALQFAAPAICGLVSMINGTSTADTLWSTVRGEGDQKTFLSASYEVITIETYEAFIAGVRAQAGL